MERVAVGAGGMGSDWMAAPNAADVGGAGWPDVALAIVAFAREDTAKFLLIVVILAIVVWFLFPRATAMLRENYRGARLKRRREASAEKDRTDD